jgi:hypothetical protein
VTDLGESRKASVLTPDRVVCLEGMDRLLLDVASRAAYRHDCHDLDRLPMLGRYGGAPAPARRSMLANDAWAEAVAGGDVTRIDADAMAEWMISRYPAPTYPGVVLGSPHGSAVHLAAALGAPWLPTGFTVTVRWRGGAVDDWGAATEAGATVAAGILATNPAVTVRQVHDPLRRGPLCASTLTMHVQWLRLPPAYRRFLERRLAPGAASLLLRDLRTWPVLDVIPGHTFQLGSPVSGWLPEDYTMDNPAFAKLIREAGGAGAGSAGAGTAGWRTPPGDLPRRYAELSGEPGLEPDLRRVASDTGRATHRVLYSTAEALSACVADLHRDWLRADGRPVDRCVVETERLLDPWQVVRSGSVPYWCESASERAVCGSEWWLAGSRTFDSVDVLPEPPGSGSGAHAGLGQWRALAAFAGRHGTVSREAALRYPGLPLPTSHATAVSRIDPVSRSPLPRIRMDQVVNGLRNAGQTSGILVL